MGWPTVTIFLNNWPRAKIVTPATCCPEPGGKTRSWYPRSSSERSTYTFHHPFDSCPRSPGALQPPRPAFGFDSERASGWIADVIDERHIRLHRLRGYG